MMPARRSTRSGAQLLFLCFYWPLGALKEGSHLAYEVLDSVSSASDLTKLETIYELTLDALKATANQRPGAQDAPRKPHRSPRGEAATKQMREALVQHLREACEAAPGDGPGGEGGGGRN